MCPEIDKHEFHWRIIPLEGLAGHYLMQKYFLTQRQENTWLVLAISRLWVKFEINLPLLFFKVLSHPFLHEFVAGIRDQHFFSFLRIANKLLKFLKTLEWSERYFKMNNKNEVNLSENCHEHDKLRCGILSKKFERMSLTCFSPMFHFFWHFQGGIEMENWAKTG